MRTLNTAAKAGLLLCSTVVLWPGCGSRQGVGVLAGSGWSIKRVAAVPQGKQRWYKLQFLNDHDAWLALGPDLWGTKDAGKTWKHLYDVEGLAKRTASIESIQFVTSETGWMRLLDKVYRTGDGGQTWEPMRTPFGGDTGTLESFYFFSNGRIGFVVGGWPRRPTSRREVASLTKYERWETNSGVMVIEGAIFRTDDGGVSWRRQRLPSSRLSLGPLRSVRFYNEHFGMALGLNNAFHTTIESDSWKAIAFDERCVDREIWRKTEDERFPIALTLGAGNIGWLSFRDGYLTGSTDGGYSWCDLLQPGHVRFEEPYGFFLQLHSLDSHTGLGLGSDNLLYETKDGARTWARVTFDSQKGTTHFDSICFVGPRQGWAVSAEGLYRLSQ